MEKNTEIKNLKTNFVQENHIWRVVPTLREIVMKCAELMKKLKLDISNMFKALTFLDNSVLETDVLEKSRIFNISQIIVNSLKERYELSLNINKIYH